MRYFVPEKTHAESCSERFVSRDSTNGKCTGLVNAWVMLIGLRPTPRSSGRRTELRFSFIAGNTGVAALRKYVLGNHPFTVWTTSLE